MIEFADLHEMEQRSGPEALSGLFGTAPSDDQAAALAGALGEAGRVADALAIALEHRSILRRRDVLPGLLQAMAAAGRADLMVKSGIFEGVAKDPAKTLSALGGGLMRGAAPLLERMPGLAATEGYVGLLLHHVLFAQPDVFGPPVLALGHRQFGAQKTEEAALAAMARHDRRLPAWLPVTLARDDPGYLPYADPVLAADRVDVFPEQRVIARFGAGRFIENLTPMTDREAQRDGWGLPALDPARLRAGVQGAIDAARAMMKDHSAYLDRLAPAMEPGRGPILVLSTGRVGTRSLNALLIRSQGYAPFHFLNFHQEAGDLNAQFYRYLTGTASPETLASAFRRFLHDRMMELIWCAKRGVRPVIINHLDMVHAPFYLALFPELDVIEMRRDPAKTLISHAYKRQFRYQQIRPVYHRFDPDGMFHMARPKALSLEQTVVWFMTATERMGEVLSSLTAPGRYTLLDMDRCFGREAEALRAFEALFPDPTITADSLADHFAERINEKSHYEVPEAFRDTDRAADLYESCRAILMEKGRYPGLE